MRDENERLTTEIEAKVATNQRLTEKVELLQSELESVHTLFESKTQEQLDTLEQLQKELEEVDHQLEESEELLSQRSLTIQKKNEEIAVCNEDILKLEKLVQDLRMRTGDQNKDTEDLQLKLQQLTDINQNLNQLVLEKEKEISSMEGEFLNLSKDIESMESSLKFFEEANQESLQKLKDAGNEL